MWLAIINNKSTKSCLVAIGVVAGTMGAWAEAGDVKTNIDVDFSNAIYDVWADDEE